MRNTIRIISFISLAFIFGAVGANAQSLRSAFDADIPFDFAIGNKSFAAGTYRLRIAGEPNGIKLLEIRNSQHDVLYRGFMAENGERINESAELRFDSSTDQRSLAKIVTSKAGFAIPKKKSVRLIAVSKEPKPISATN